MAELGFFRGERVELIHGMVVRMAPIGPPHTEVVDLLTELLVVALVGRARVRIQQPLVAGDTSEPEPDIAIVPRGDYRDHHPDRALLVIEVAESSLSYDMSTKAELYASSNVAEYWVVDVEAEALTVFRGPAGGAYSSSSRHGRGSSVAPVSFPEVEVSMDSLFRRA